MKRAPLAILTVLLVASPALAQHDDASHGDMHDMHDMPGMPDMPGMGHDDHGHEHGEAGAHAGAPLGLPPGRDGSGTAWLPDETPVRGVMAMAGGWHLMLHGNLFVGVSHHATPRGGTDVASQNWLMAMAAHPAGGGRFEARAMLSLEPLTLGDDGYRELLQTGETLDGMPLVDRQHPHDLFMELAARYQRELGGGVAFDVYVAPAGEPALGPVAFPHRPSAMPDPIAPIVHHWQDSTHISYGVVTAGLYTRVAKLEGSWFNGREPDEERWDLDLRAPDSYAVRLSVNPHPRWSVQASYGRLASPEARHPDESVDRATASATHVARLGGDRRWTSTLAVGWNLPADGPITHGALVETALDLGRLGTTFLRAEQVDKTGEDFGLAMTHATVPIAALSLGHVHPIARLGALATSLGVRGSIAHVDALLADRYRTRWPAGVMAYLQVQPAIMQ